jgi:hypothetical protein
VPLPFDGDAGRFDDSASGRHHLRTNAVAGNECDAVDHGGIVSAAGSLRQRLNGETINGGVI